MLYLVRHGSTEQPALRAPGDMRPPTREEWLFDHPLSDQGQAEALLLRRRFERIGPADRYLSSPRRRARETAAIAIPETTPVIDERLHEWCDAESAALLCERTRWVLDLSATGVVVAFTHGNFIRAVVASAMVGTESARFEASFHDARRMLQILNASLTIFAPGPTGPEVVGVDLCHPVDELAGRAQLEPSGETNRTAARTLSAGS